MKYLEIIINYILKYYNIIKNLYIKICKYKFTFNTQYQRINIFFIQIFIKIIYLIINYSKFFNFKDI